MNEMDIELCIWTPVKIFVVDSCELCHDFSRYEWSMMSE